MPIAKKTDIPQDFLNQMKTNLSKSSPVEEEPANAVSSQIKTASLATEQKTEKNYAAPVQAKAAEEKKDKYADVMNIRLSKGRRNEIKAFCTSHGITVTQYIESSFEFFAREVAEGNIAISKGGITKISQ